MGRESRWGQPRRRRRGRPDPRRGSPLSRVAARCELAAWEAGGTKGGGGGLAEGRGGPPRQAPAPGPLRERGARSEGRVGWLAAPGRPLGCRPRSVRALPGAAGLRGAVVGRGGVSGPGAGTSARLRGGAGGRRGRGRRTRPPEPLRARRAFAGLF